jgi:hypothetical protein
MTVLPCTGYGELHYFVQQHTARGIPTAETTHGEAAQIQASNRNDAQEWARSRMIYRAEWPVFSTIKEAPLRITLGYYKAWAAVRKSIWAGLPDVPPAPPALETPVKL